MEEDLVSIIIGEKQRIYSNALINAEERVMMKSNRASAAAMWHLQRKRIT